MEEPRYILPIDENNFKASLKSKETHSISRFKLGDFTLLVNSLLAIKKACAFANLDAKTIKPDTASRIIKSCDELRRLEQKEIFMVDVLQGGGGYAINGNVNEAIRALDAVTHKDMPVLIEDINKSQSSSDVCSTALRIALHRQSLDLTEKLDQLILSIETFITRDGAVKTLARTCWQDALSISMGERFLGVKESFFLRSERLKNMAAEMLMVSLGSTVLGNGALATSPYQETVITHLSRILELDLARHKTPMVNAQNFPDLAALAAEIRMVSEGIIRLGLDLRILSSGPYGGLFEITLPKIMQSSSFFPNKFNPTIVETAIQGAIFSHALCSSIDSYRMMPEIDLNVFEWASGVNLILSLEVLIDATQCFTKNALAFMTANRERCEQLAQYALLKSS